MRKAVQVQLDGALYAERRFYAEDTARFMCWGSSSMNERIATSLLPALVPAVVEVRTEGPVDVVRQRWVDAPTLADRGITIHTAALAGAALGVVHRNRRSRAGSLNGGRSFASTSAAFGSRWAHAVGLLATVDSALAGELAAWGQRQLTIMPACPEARLVHGDYGPTNILLDGDRVQIIDWEHARWGDPYEDLAKIRAAQRFPEPNGFGSEDVIWRAFTSAWQESANVSWTCDPAAKELYEVYYIVCLAVFFGTLPNHRLHHLRQLVGETPGDPIRGFQDACTAKHGGHDAQHYRLRGEQRP